MHKTSEELKAVLLKKRKANLGFYPTPLYKLDNISKALEVDLYIKREDFSGQSVFGGNKIRKLEYLLGDAIAHDAEYVFTYGATQSNHAMETVECCNKLGLKPIIYLYALVEPKENDIKGNLLLDKILGAEVHIINIAKGESQKDVELRSQEMAMEHINRLEKSGHKCYNITTGGATPIGTAGFVEGYLELLQQLKELHIEADYLFHANGTGSTMAGLAIGKKLLDSSIKIVSIDVSKHDEAYLQDKAELANKTLEWLGLDQIIKPTDFCTEGNYYLPGYEQPNKYGTEAIKMLAKKEGLFVDPVYSGKALGGLIDYIRTGRIKKGSKVVFLHTGGATALFAEKEILGEIF